MKTVAGSVLRLVFTVAGLPHNGLADVDGNEERANILQKFSSNTFL